MMINLIFRVVILVKTLTPQFVLGKGLSCSHMPWDVRVAAHAKKVKLQSTPTLDSTMFCCIRGYRPRILRSKRNVSGNIELNY